MGKRKRAALESIDYLKRSKDEEAETRPSTIKTRKRKCKCELFVRLLHYHI